MPTNDFLAVFAEIIPNRSQILCKTWLEEELRLLSRKPNKELPPLVVNNLRAYVNLIQSIRKSGKEDLYAEFTYALRFGSSSLLQETDDTCSGRDCHYKECKASKKKKKKDKGPKEMNDPQASPNCPEVPDGQEQEETAEAVQLNGQKTIITGLDYSILSVDYFYVLECKTENNFILM